MTLILGWYNLHDVSVSLARCRQELQKAQLQQRQLGEDLAMLLQELQEKADSLRGSEQRPGDRGWGMGDGGMQPAENGGFTLLISV